MNLPISLERKGDTLHAEGQAFKVRKRKGHKDKPSLFLVRFAPAFEYISSLFPVPGQAGVYTLDYRGQVYTLTLEATQANLCPHSAASVETQNTSLSPSIA